VRGLSAVPLLKPRSISLLKPAPTIGPVENLKAGCKIGSSAPSVSMLMAALSPGYEACPPVASVIPAGCVPTRFLSASASTSGPSLISKTFPSSSSTTIAQPFQPLRFFFFGLASAEVPFPFPFILAEVGPGVDSCPLAKPSPAESSLLDALVPRPRPPPLVGVADDAPRTARGVRCVGTGLEGGKEVRARGRAGSRDVEDSMMISWPWL
jgi:hypothetical protein